MKNIYAEKGKVYTFKEIGELTLRDTPCLLVMHDDMEGVVQYSYSDLLGILENEKWANSKWLYVRETYEWIPIFKFVDKEISLYDLIDYEPRLGCHIEEKEYWITPKGFPRTQT